MKYDIVSIQFSRANPLLCYIGGMDNEIICDYFGTHQLRNGFRQDESDAPIQGILQQNHRLGFRGDARWIGITTTELNGDDLLMGVCENGALYAVTPAQGISGHVGL